MASMSAEAPGRRLPTAATTLPTAPLTAVAAEARREGSGGFGSTRVERLAADRAAFFLRAVFGRAGVVTYGPQAERVGGATELFVLPCPSGLACRWWAANEVWWHRLADRHRALRGGSGDGPGG